MNTLQLHKSTQGIVFTHMDLSANLYILGGKYNTNKKNNNKNIETICIKPSITKFNDKASQLSHQEAKYLGSWAPILHVTNRI